LNALREGVRKQLHPLAEDLTRISKQSAAAKTHKARVRIEATWSRDVQALCDTITSKMKGFVRELLSECIELAMIVLLKQNAYYHILSPKVVILGVLYPLFANSSVL